MTQVAETLPMNRIDLKALILRACDRIAPAWPLDRMIAVNPYWSHRDRSFNDTAAHLMTLSASPLAMPITYYKALWDAGKISAADLQQAIIQQGAKLSEEEAIQGLTDIAEDHLPVPLLCDVLDRQRDLQREPAWCDTITHQVSQFFAAWFDELQADWSPQCTEKGLYADWLYSMRRDHSVALLMKDRTLTTRAHALPDDAIELIHSTLADSAIPPANWQDYLEAVLLRLNGWSSCAAYHGWQARLADTTDDTLLQVLAVRLAWERLLDDGLRSPDSNWQRWQRAWNLNHNPAESTGYQLRLLWQRAHELAYQNQLAGQLSGVSYPGPQPVAEVQAVFCIDVRSEVFRRHLEKQSDRIQTLGFAGFFGLPVSYRPIGTEATRPQLPGLLAPAFEVTDTTGHKDTDIAFAERRRGRLSRLSHWRPFKSAPASAFSMVEVLGLGYAGKLLRESLAQTKPSEELATTGLTAAEQRQLRPDLRAALASVDTQADLAEQVLTGMNLRTGLARLVLLLGHGSQSRNNPQRAGLDCGACCGQTGEVNARALADILNDVDVRRVLQQRGCEIPEETRFIAGLHNTTTDEVALFESDSLPESSKPLLQRLRSQLADAGHGARLERAPALMVDAQSADADSLLKTLRQRANDWSQTRPEWGLARNAAFIVAPRWRTRGLDLQGRTFLHEYDPQKDSKGGLLTQIMTAPMIVTNWINLQYYASTVDNPRYGSGNKTLHNVVGGNIGVFEGNGGDLRTGLAMQSVHDGQDWVHEPLRLTVVIDAPAQRIEAVIREHEMVRDLVDHQWLYLARFTDEEIEFRPQQGWG